jgi:murein DD-endopeptidase MepM/ murein hydrolase activator NlpD
METKNKYALPVKEKDIEQTRYDSPAHTGKLKYSVDYMCKENTKLLAAQDGEVVWIKENSKKGGPDKKYWNDGNRVVIKHENGEYSAYEHLRYKGAKVKVGDKVKKGQLIGYSGNTGYTFGPHLHFEVFKFTGPNKEEDFETLKINFNNKDGGLEKKFNLFTGIFLIVGGMILSGPSITGFSIFSGNNPLPNVLSIALILIGISELFFFFRRWN